MAREDVFKTVSFGGYDKNTVDEYIATLKKEHQSDIADLKVTIGKLGETVRNMQQAKEQMKEQSDASNNKDIARLASENKELQEELAVLRQEVENYKNKDQAFTDKYNAISKTLIESRERADHLIADAEKQSKEMLRKAQVERDNLRVKTEEEHKVSVSRTEQQCKQMLAQAKHEKEQLMLVARSEAAEVKTQMQQQCESVNTYMNSLMESVEGVLRACNDTKRISSKAFNGIEVQQERSSVDTQSQNR